VDELALASSDAVAVQTAARVLLNTIEAAVAQSQGPSPEKLAIIALIDERVRENQSSIQTLIGDYLQDQLDDFMSNWMSNNFDVTDYNVDDAIEAWADNNMDDKIQDAISNLEFSVTVK
jgi:hypothetical protein